jgi:hypothetical protein
MHDAQNNAATSKYSIFANIKPEDLLRLGPGFCSLNLKA